MSRTHGQSHTPIYVAWRGMWKRCTNRNNVRFKDYGGRGIKVCERWKKFENFYADMGEKPSPTHSLDRINNDGNYEPTNCRWATRRQQHRNRRPQKNHCRGHIVPPGIGDLSRYALRSSLLQYPSEIIAKPRDLGKLSVC